MSIARSTPAQNDRGPARRSVLGATAAAHSERAPLTRRRLRKRSWAFDRHPGIGKRASRLVGDHPDDGERPAGRSRCEPGRLHVDRERRPGVTLAVGRPENPARRGERPDVDAQPSPPERSDEERASRNRGTGAVVVDELGGAEYVAGAQRRVDAGAEARHGERGRLVCERSGRRDPRPVGPHPGPDDRRARRLAQGKPLDPHRRQHEQLRHERPPRMRPSAITGNTSR